MGLILQNLPNDEPLRPSENKFDEFILGFSKGSILKKIGMLKDINHKRE